MDSALIVAVFVIACCASVAILRIIAERMEFAQRFAQLRIETERLRAGRRDHQG